MASELPDSEEEGLAHASLAQAGAALHGRRPDIPAGFVAHLYARTVPEDVVRYDAVELAALAERAFDFLASARRARRKSAARPCACTRPASTSW